MRIRTLPLSLTLGAMAFSALTACSGGASEPPGAGGGQGSSDSAAVDGTAMSPVASGPAGNAPGSAELSTTAPVTTVQPTTVQSTTVDIRTVDLANTTWLYSYGGFDLPVTLQLVDGAADDAGDGYPIRYELNEVSYGDVDGDGVEDAVAKMSRTQSNGYEALWYVWLTDGAEAVQMKYPIVQTSRCGTFVESVVIGDGVITTTEYLRIPGLDDAIPCSEPGTGLKKRTITIHAEGPDTWPVQTVPVAAWGGLCPGPLYNESSPGVADLWAAPAKNAPVTATKSPDGGAMFEQKVAPLLQREGWLLIGVKLSGMANEQGVTEMECAWALK